MKTFTLAVILGMVGFANAETTFTKNPDGTVTKTETFDEAKTQEIIESLKMKMKNRQENIYRMTTALETMNTEQTQDQAELDKIETEKAK